MTALLAAGIVGTTLFVVTFLVDGATRPEYAPTYHAVSALALGPRGWVQTASFVVSGALVTASAAGIGLATGTPWLAVPVAVFGLALVASGVFRMDPMRGYPPGTPDGTPEETSRSHELHDHAGAGVFAALPAAAIAGALVLDDLPWVLYSAVTAVVLLLSAGRFATDWEADAPRTGLVQRVMIVIGWTWLGAVCWHLLP